MVRLCQRLNAIDAPLLVAGDSKGPTSYDLKPAVLLSLLDQLDSGYRLAKLLPTKHYARKNVGYLAAIAQGARCIYETDDDNAPLASWSPRLLTVSAQPCNVQGWVNAYRYFTDERIWPRGFALEYLKNEPALMRPSAIDIVAPIQQGLANVAPDVDAIWRLVQDRPLSFRDGPSLALAPGCWCPFNSQSTWWWPTAYPLMYLPSYCSFRMTDIWRSFVAQRCLWEIGGQLVFHAAEVEQDRNEHDLMKDFADEIPGYQRNREIVEVLQALQLNPGPQAVGENLRRCYQRLIELGVIGVDELNLIDAWLQDLADLNVV
jgi:hypothetical protein